MIEQTIADAPAFSARRIVVRASSLLLAFERIALMGLMYLLTALILVKRRHALFALPDLLDR